MKLYFIQHGEAKHEAEDPGRSLTAKSDFYSEFSILLSTIR